MRRSPGRLGWFPVAGLAALLASILAFLYARAPAYNGSGYFENVALLRQIQQLDARWERDVLRSKIGINADYDPLADHLVELERLRERLAAVVAGRAGSAGAELGAAYGAYRQAIEEKARLVEQFKSHNAVLRNSLSFLPTAAADVRHLAEQAAGRDQGIRRQVVDGVNRVLLAGLEYNQAASNDKAIEIEKELGRLAPAVEKLPAEVGEGLDILAAHVRAVVRRHDQVDQLLNRIAAVPAAEHIDAIHRLLGGEQQRAALESRQYRRYLLAFSAVVIGLFLYAAACLIRSHATINRINEALRQANEGLEQRVQERTEALRAAQSELLATARRAGMAEIATNVLHNVGNVLNSVNVSAAVIGRQLQGSEAPGLARAVQLMNEHAADLGGFLTRDPKGKLLPSYLGMLAEALAAEQQSLAAELGQLTRSIDHIKDIVATQQSYAGAARMVAPVRVRELVEDALLMNAGALMRHEVTVVREFAEVPVLWLDRHRVLQILINLISNAKYAMDEVTGRERRMILRIEVADGTDGGVLRIGVADEGVGIPAENLTRIFAHGFTTRPGGHGFGLHSCVLAAREMGGTLTVHSDGPGQGAVFTLELPIAGAPDAELAKAA